MAIPEPGLTNPPRLHEFMYELRILDKPLVKTVPVGDTLSDIYREVNHAAGRIEGAALPAILNKKSRLKRKTTWTVDEASFVGRDELILDEGEYDEELFFKEAISMVYSIVRMAHSNISSYRDLDPPWASFQQLVDSKYLLPDIPMSIPTALRQPNCFKYLKHWFTVTKGLRFKQWQRKNGLPMDPVPLGERWWASSLPSYMRSEEILPPAALAAIQYVPKAPHSVGKEGPRMVVSPYGSQGGRIVHGDAASEQEALEMLDIPSVPDPEDLLPIDPSAEHISTHSTEDDHAPYLVPENSEARGQWSISQLQSNCSGLSPRATRSLRSAIRQLVELPMVPNCSYPLKAVRKRVGLPDDLRWTMRSAQPPASADMDAWLSFLQGSPWRVTQAGVEAYAGTELAWIFVLGWVCYLRGYSSAGGTAVGDLGVGRFSVGSATFVAVFDDFLKDLSQYADQYEYPGWAPCSRYALANSRTHYLAYLVRNEEQDVLLPLLRLVARMAGLTFILFSFRTTKHHQAPGDIDPPFTVVHHASAKSAPSWITERYGVPSWQWQRCGLPPSSHALPDLAQTLLEWLRRPDLLVDCEAGRARSRETGLAVFLKAALLFVDLENMDDANWTYAGAAALEHSALRPHTRQLKNALSEWANEAAIRLEAALPARGDIDLLGEMAAEASSLDDVDFAGGDARSDASDRLARRQPASDFMPADVDATFLAVDLEDVRLPHTVAEYRQAIDEEPRTAVQELTRKALQGLAALEDRKRANRSLKAGRVIGDVAAVKKASRAPAAKVTAGAWQPMPPEDPSPSSSDNDEPPAKRRKTLIVRKPRASEARIASKAPKTKPRRIPPRPDVAQHGGRGALKSRRGRKKRKVKTPEPPSTSSDSAAELSQNEGRDSTIADDAEDTGEDSEQMPARISIPCRSRFDRLIMPVTFEAEGASSSGMDMDSDAIGSAASTHPALARRLAFVEPRRPVDLARASPNGRPVEVSSTPALSGGYAQSLAEDEAVARENSEAGALRRSARNRKRLP
ncbi:unnamed protein product [Peniophora sp. CBMAI 1063]|nr:unnamed protein product [Peniophora sp. CBMAI 1063]